LGLLLLLSVQHPGLISNLSQKNEAWSTGGLIGPVYLLFLIVEIREI